MSAEVVTYVVAHCDNCGNKLDTHNAETLNDARENIRDDGGSYSKKFNKYLCKDCNGAS